MEKKFFKNIDSLVSALSLRLLSAESILKWALDNNVIFNWHPLGFIMATIMREGDRKIRIHIWKSDKSNQQEPAWMIHDHVFDLSSWVLCGEIKNTEYDISYDVNNSSWCTYSVSYNSSGSILTREDNLLSLSESRSFSIKAGETYSIKSGVFHKSEKTSNKDALSVCLTKDISTSKPLVIGDINGNRKYNYVRKPVNDINAIIKNIEI